MNEFAPINATATATGCAAAATTVRAITFEEQPTVLSLPMPPRASDEFHRRFFNHHPRKRKAEVKPEPEKRAKTEPHQNEDEECTFLEKMRYEARLLARAYYTGVPSIDW
jgi:hypothetical protein